MTLSRVRLDALGIETSALGFGCASLGSRISPEAGIAALSRAYDAGVTWFDVAPSYGDGQAENLLGRFLAGQNRENVQVLTKVGIAPPATTLKARLLRPAMRAAVKVMPRIRTTVRRRRPTAIKLPIDAALIAQSLDASLRRLGTHYVDVLALHDASPQEATRDDVQRALETAVASGKAKAAAIASSPEAAAAGIAACDIYRLVQMGNNLLEPGLERFREASGRQVAVVTHSVFGNENATRQLVTRIEGDTEVRAALTMAGYQGPAQRVATNLLADFAFATNRGGVIVVSMFKEHHLRNILARHALAADEGIVRALAAKFGKHHDRLCSAL